MVKLRRIFICILLFLFCGCDNRTKEFKELSREGQNNTYLNYVINELHWTTQIPDEMKLVIGGKFNIDAALILWKRKEDRLSLEAALDEFVFLEGMTKSIYLASEDKVIAISKRPLSYGGGDAEFKRYTVCGFGGNTGNARMTNQEWQHVKTELEAGRAVKSTDIPIR